MCTTLSPGASWSCWLTSASAGRDSMSSTLAVASRPSASMSSTKPVRRSSRGSTLGSLTKLPRPGCRSISPMVSRSRRARRTVVRLTLKAAISCGSVGTWSPGCRRPDRIWVSSSVRTTECMGTSTGRPNIAPSSSDRRTNFGATVPSATAGEPALTARPPRRGAGRGRPGRPRPARGWRSAPAWSRSRHGAGAPPCGRPRCRGPRG